MNDFNRNKKQIDPNLKPKELERQAYIRCIRMLGTREHSYAELQKKLGSSGFSTETIEAVLQQLIAAGYQSDERFACLFSEQLLRRNRGPMAISAKLSSRGIDSSLAKEAISAALRESGLNWAEVASEALMARFSAGELALLSDREFEEDGANTFENEDLTRQQRFERKAELRDQAQQRKAKYARFLNGRGFSTTDSIRAIRLVAETVSE